MGIMLNRILPYFMNNILVLIPLGVFFRKLSWSVLRVVFRFNSIRNES